MFEVDFYLHVVFIIIETDNDEEDGGVCIRTTGNSGDGEGELTASNVSSESNRVNSEEKGDFMDLT